MQVAVKPHLFDRKPRVDAIPHGKTVAEIVEHLKDKETFDGAVVVEINGDIVPQSMWHCVKPKEKANVNVYVDPQGGGGGGKNPLQIVFQIVILVASIYFPPLAALGLAPAAQLALRVGILVAGSLLQNALFKPSAPSLDGLNTNAYKDSPTYSITGGRNEARLFQPVPVVIGKHKVIPAYGTLPYTEISGDDEYLNQLFIGGYGPIKIEDIKIGDTPLDDYDDVEIEIREGFEDDDPITIIPNQVSQNNIGAQLEQATSWVQRNTSSNTDKISVDIAFTRGLTAYNNQGQRIPRTVTVEVQYRASGATTWISRPDIVTTRTSVGTVRVGQAWSVDRGSYEVRLRRTTADSSSNQIVDDTTWSVLRSFRNDPPVNFPFPLAMIAVRIKASGQLNGAIDQLSFTGTSYVDEWDGSEWVANQPSQNPASLMRAVLLHNANARRRSLAQIDDTGFVDFWNWCNDRGYQFNMVRDFRSSVWDVCQDICSAARAAPTIIDGKWSAILDDPDKPVAQYFTPRNSWGFESTKNFPIIPDAFRVKFFDEDNGYKEDERIVYADGKDADNATTFEGLEVSGVTSSDLAWKHARYHLAQTILRPETYSFKTGLDNLRCTRGDIIEVGHDVPLWGNGYPRVKSLVTSGSNTTGIVVDDPVIMVTGNDYVIKVRRDDGTSFLADLVNVSGENSELEFVTPVATDDGPQVGDLCMFGVTELETVKLIVKAINPSKNEVATLICEDYAPDIQNADTGPIPPFVPNVSSQPDITQVSAAIPTITNIESGTAALEVDATGNFRARIIVSVAPNSGSPRTEYFVVRIRRLTGEWRSITGDEGQTVFSFGDVVEGDDYEIQAKSVTIYGIHSAWSTSQFETVVGQSEPPGNVTGFSVNIIGSSAYLSWDAVGDIDVKSYRIRWAPEKSGVTWGSAVDVMTGVTTNSATIPAQVGTYLVKAVDYAGNESPIAAAAITNISYIRGLNFVEALEEGPDDWAGTFADTRYDPDLVGITLDWVGAQLLTESGDTLVSESGDNLFASVPDGGFVGSGTYELPGYIDLQDVFTVRSSATIEAQGYDIFSAIQLLTESGDTLTTEAGDLIQAEDPSSAPEGSWNVKLQYAITNDDPAGSPTWSDWNDFVVGDLTARALKARIVVTGTPINISPLITMVNVTLDMEDRVVGFQAAVGTGGATITFDPAFFVVPEIGISVSDGQEGDSYVITSKSEGSFDIAFTNGGSPVARNISGVAKAYGERAA